MKFKLTIQSLAPLFILLLIQNIGRWNTRDEYKNYYIEFIQDNWFVILAELILIIMLIIAIVSFFLFNSWKKYGQETHDVIIKTSCVNEHSLTFFMTYIIPLMVSNFLDIRSLLCCMVLLLIVIVLMFKTELFYQNPVLALLGYNIFEVNIKNMQFICIVKGTLIEGDYIRKKKISKNIYIVRKIK